MARKLVQNLADELVVWRTTLEHMRTSNASEVDSLIGHINASIDSIKALRAADAVDDIVR